MKVKGCLCYRYGWELELTEVYPGLLSIMQSFVGNVQISGFMHSIFYIRNGGRRL